MNRREQLVRTLAGATLVLTLLPAPAAAQGARAAALDACALLTNDEIAAATGATVRSSRPGSVPDGSECRYQTRAGFALTLTLSPVDPKDFDELRGLFGDDARVVTGVGDAAYFLGDERIYVRVGRRQLVVSRGSQGDAKTREGLLAIGKLAVPRLR